jgi:hypothetical protein
MPNTSDQEVAEKIGRAIDGQMLRLNEEKTTLLAASTRIAAIDGELAVLAAEKARIDARRPPGPPTNPGPPSGAIVANPSGNVR